MEIIKKLEELLRIYNREIKFVGEKDPDGAKVLLHAKIKLEEELEKLYEEFDL